MDGNLLGLFGPLRGSLGLALLLLVVILAKRMLARSRHCVRRVEQLADSRSGEISSGKVRRRGDGVRREGDVDGRVFAAVHRRGRHGNLQHALLW